MRWSGIAAGLGLLLLGAAHSQAAVLYATGFENPPFVLGPINGQAGWSVFSASSQTSDPVIESSLVKTGLQAVRVDGSVTGQTGPIYTPNFVDPQLDLSADIYIASSSIASEWQFATTGAGGIGFAGGIDVVGTSLVGITDSYPVIGSLSRDAWHHVDIILNYTSQTYSVDLDGSTVAANLAFCGNNFGTCNGAAVDSMGWTLFDSFGHGNDLGAMDNFSIATVPEPATLALLATGLLGLGLRRQRRRQ
jgi:hypothetical protein